jgi:hypothetical protein
MKYIKLFEDIDNNLHDLQVGDYVICYCSDPDRDFDADSINSFLSNSIGLVFEPSSNYEESFLKKQGYFKYPVKYDNVPDDMLNYFNSSDYRYMYFKEILHWSSNREDLEIYLDINKYNI